MVINSTSKLDDPLPHPSLTSPSGALILIVLKQLKVGTLVEVAVVQDHTSIATPLFLGAYLEVFIEPHSYLCLPCQETLNLDAAIEV